MKSGQHVTHLPIPEKRQKLCDLIDLCDSEEDDNNRNQAEPYKEESTKVGYFCENMVMPCLVKICGERKSAAKLNIQAVLHNIEFGTSIATTDFSHIKTQNSASVQSPYSISQDKAFCMSVINPSLKRLSEEKKSWAKLEIQRVLHEARFSTGV